MKTERYQRLFNHTVLFKSAILDLFQDLVLQGAVPN